MIATNLYDASPINPRRRATRHEMEDRARFYINYASIHGPVTVRQLYYRAVVEGITGIDKTENGYTRVQRQVLNLRRDGRLPYHHIADASRWMRKPRTWDSVADALRETATTYRKALWRDQGLSVEVWRKNALAGVVYPVTELYDTPLMPTVGFTSETFAFEAVESAEPGIPYIVYALYDFDRSGQHGCRSLREKLERFAAKRGIEASFRCLALAERDIDLNSFDPRESMVDVFLQGVGWRRLPTREPKRISAADKAWPYPFAIELDAIEPDDLRNVVRWAMEQHMPAAQLKILQAAEESERELFAALVHQVRRERPGALGPEAPR